MTPKEPSTYMHEAHEIVYKEIFKKESKIFFGLKNGNGSFDTNTLEERHKIYPIFNLFKKGEQYHIYENLKDNDNWKAALELNKPYRKGLNMFGKINSFLLTSDFHLSDNNNTGNLTEIEKYEEMLNNIEYDDINERRKTAI